MTNSAQDSLVGTRLQDYEILDVISTTDTETVYKAKHATLNEDRTIRVIRFDPDGDPKQVENFLKAAEVLVSLRHPNLVQTYDFGKIDDYTCFLAVESLEGETLIQKIRREKLNNLEALGIARQAGLALQLAHERKVVHGQISGESLFLVKNEFDEITTKVVNFGFVKPRTDQSNAEYLSPEQCDAAAEVDFRSDIYSLGMTLYHMIAGKLPFDASNLEGYMAKPLHEKIEPVSSHAPPTQVPKELDDLILKALSKEKNNRQASMAEMIQEIDKVLLLDSSTTAIINTPLPRMELGPGFLFAGRYLIEKRLGRGGMGTVYKAMDQTLEIPVALKTLNKEIAGEERTLKRLKREVILARKVAHPNVCRIYDISETEGTPYVSMEFVAGRTLAEILISDGKFKPEIGVSILKQLLSALQEAHRAGVIHRDLKPQNIMVDSNNHAYIMDFGISISEDLHRLTETGILIGTPRYMAPEQFGSRNVDHRADIYSIGIMMFEMFTGQLPFEANTPAAVMYAHLYSPPPKPSQLSPEISPELERIILKALEKDPQQRYASDREMITDLEALEKSGFTMPAQTTRVTATVPLTPQRTKVEPEEPTAEKKAGIAIPISASYLKKPVAWAAAGVAVLALIVGILFMRSGDSGNAAKPQVSAPTSKAPVITPPPAAAQPVVKPVVPKPGRKIQLTSQPSGGSVFVDGIDIGKKTPSELSFGIDETHQVEVKLEGYQSATATVNKDTPEYFPLQLKPVSANGKISYEGAYPVAIYNGKKLVLNTSSGKVAELPAGTYSLTLINMKGVVIRNTQKIEVKGGETIPLQAPAMATLNVTANPSNCKVVIDSEFADTCPILKLPIQAGTHEIKISWEKLQKEKSISVSIPSDSVKTVRAIVGAEDVDIFEESPK